MPSQALLCVDSADAETYNAQGWRVGNNTPSQLNLNKQRPLLFGYMTRLALTEINFQWDVPNVNKFNNTLTVALWNGAGNAVQEYVRITIAEDFYTLPKLCFAIKTALNANAVGGALNMSYDVLIAGEDVAAGTASTTAFITRPRVQIVLGAGSLGQFSFIPYNATGTIGGLAVSVPPLTDDLTNMLGFTPTLAGPITPYTSIYSGYASTLYTPYIDIESNILTKNQNVADGTSQTRTTSSKLARVYLANEDIVPREISITYDNTGVVEFTTDNAIGVSPFAFRREFRVPKVIQWNTTENVDVIDLQVLDYRGNPLPVSTNITYAGTVASIDNTADFQFTIQATEV